MLDRIRTTVGLFCLAATLILSSGGVRAVRAEEGDGIRSIDPALTAAQEARAVRGPKAAKPSLVDANAVAPPKPDSTDPAALDRAGINAVEVSPGIIVLNTDGYNYGPPAGDVDPAAARVESLTR